MRIISNLPKVMKTGGRLRDGRLMKTISSLTLVAALVGLVSTPAMARNIAVCTPIPGLLPGAISPVSCPGGTTSEVRPAHSTWAVGTTWQEGLFCHWSAYTGNWEAFLDSGAFVPLMNCRVWNEADYLRETYGQ